MGDKGNGIFVDGRSADTAKEAGGRAISASTVRQALQAGDWEELRALVPESTYRYFTGPEAAPVLDRIRRAGNVVHY